MSSERASPPRILTESSRLEAFSDGVLAIAITLLVLDLHTGAHPGAVAHDILTQWPTYLAYIASFLYIGVVWVNHHALFTRITNVDAGLLWCNLGLLLPVSVLPFPTAELAFAMHSGRGSDKLSALVLYCVISAAMAVSWLVVYSYLHAHPDLLRGDVPPGFFRAERLRALAGIIAPAAPVLIGLRYPVAALAALVAMPVFYAITAEGLRSRRRRRPDGEQTSLPDLRARRWHNRHGNVISR